MDPNSEDVEWLLHDLCTKFGYSITVSQRDHFLRLAQQGSDGFADAVLISEGVDPTLDKRLRRDVREFVAARFERWASDDPAE